MTSEEHEQLMHENRHAHLELFQTRKAAKQLDAIQKLTQKQATSALPALEAVNLDAAKHDRLIAICNAVQEYADWCGTAFDDDDRLEIDICLRHLLQALDTGLDTVTLPQTCTDWRTR